MKCNNCKKELKRIIYDVGYGVEVDSMHCETCGLNVTDNKKLEKALTKLRENMKKEVKVVKIGTGIGIRLPNDFARIYGLREKEEVLIRPELDGIKILITKASKA